MKRFLAAMVVMIFASSGAYADLTKGSQTAAIFGGVGGSETQYDYEPGDRENVTSGGGAVGAQYLYYVTGNNIFSIGVGGDVAHSFNSDNDTDEMLDGKNASARLKSTVVLPIVRATFLQGVFRPYIFTGLGFHSSSQKLTATPQAGTTWSGGGTETRTLIDENATGLAVGGGIGVDIFPTESFFFGMELRGAWLNDLDTDDTLAIRNAGYTEDTDSNGISQGNLFFRVGMKF
jgi:hypothetical protein